MEDILPDGNAPQDELLEQRKTKRMSDLLREFAEADYGHEESWC